MILTSQDQWTDLYASIKEESRKSDEKFVFIYASAQDCDAICALRILERLLKNDRIPYGVLPVTRYEEITEDFFRYYRPEETAMRTAILLNCGAAEDVRQLLELDQRPNVRVIIVDSHRPVCHTAHLDDPADAVHILLDEAEGCSKADIPPFDPDGEAASGDEDDLENDESNRPARRRRLDDSPSSSGRGSPGRREDTRTQRRKERERAEDERRQYYSKGVWFGKPAACVMYDLAYYLQMNNTHMLWLALVGLTDHYVHFRLPAQKYSDYYFHYESQVTSSGHLDVQLERDLGDGTTVNNNVSCRILPQEEFRFGLLWEWNLYEAMLYSPYVASRLQTYHEKGRVLLETLMAKAGIPLKQSQLPFIQDMKPRFRHSLQERLAAHGAAFKMSDITFKSFQLQDGPKRTVSAVDAVHAVAALLHTRRAPGPASAKEYIDQFERAYAALSWGDDRGELHKGLELAKRLQRALVMDGGAVIAQKLYNNFKQFRLYDLSDHKANYQQLLAHPMALQRLAAFFQEQSFHASGKRKPVILVGPKSDEGRCLVIGFEATNRMQGNQLGQAFAETAELVGAQSWHDLFDTSVMEIAHADVARFKTELIRLAGQLLS